MYESKRDGGRGGGGAAAKMKIVFASKRFINGELWTVICERLKRICVLNVTVIQKRSSFRFRNRSFFFFISDWGQATHISSDRATNKPVSDYLCFIARIQEQRERAFRMRVSYVSMKIKNLTRFNVQYFLDKCDGLGTKIYIYERPSKNNRKWKKKKRDWASRQSPKFKGYLIVYHINRIILKQFFFN